MTILTQDPETGYWNKIELLRRVKDDSLLGWTSKRTGRFTTLRTHTPAQCEGRLCDVHNRRGEGVQATWPLNWRSDRGIMEVICPCGIGHPTPGQVEYWAEDHTRKGLEGMAMHGCCGVHCPIGEL